MQLCSNEITFIQSCKARDMSDSKKNVRKFIILHPDCLKNLIASLCIKSGH